MENNNDNNNEKTERSLQRALSSENKIMEMSFNKK